MNEYFEKVRAERLAWKAAYDAADESTKKQMLEERVKTAKERAEKERMEYEKDRKARFMTKSDRQIEVYNLLVSASEIAKKHIQKFDGKVLNNRLTKAIETELKNVSKMLGASLDYTYDYNTKRNVGRLELKVYYASDYDCTEIIRLFMDENGRLLAEKTLAGMNDILTQKIANVVQAKNDYDAALEKAREIYAMIEEYTHGFHYTIRDFFGREGIINNKSCL